MSFNSIEYLFFLPTVFLLYWLVFKKRNMQNVLLVVASYVFYAAWDWRCLFLITLTSFCSFASGQLFAKNAGGGRVIYVANFILNIGILCVFKYLNFFGDSFAHLLTNVGLQADWVTLDIILL